MSRNHVQDLRQETETARTLLREVAATLGDDQELIETTIEGETGLMEALERACNRVCEIDVLLAGIDLQKKKLREREERLEAQKETLRAAVCASMEIAGLKRLELAVATVTRKAVPPKLVITAEEDIPQRYWRLPEVVPVLVKKELTDDLKAQAKLREKLGKGVELTAEEKATLALRIEGASLSNGAETVQFSKS